MATNTPATPMCPDHTYVLARIIEAGETRLAGDAACTIQLLEGGDIAGASLSDPILRRGIAIRPGHLVLVIARDAPAAEGAAALHEVVWRGPTDLALPDDAQSRARLCDEWIVRAQEAAQRMPAAAQPIKAEAADPDTIRRLVAEGYDRMAERYAAWTANDIVDDVRPRYAAQLLDRLPAGARVLELGCGGGGPTTQLLAARFALTGIDISARQIELARASVPGVEVIHGDMTRVDFPPGIFDGVAGFYSLLHLPHGELPTLLHKIATWLRPDGLLVATLTAHADPGTIEPQFLGVPMYFSGYAPEDARRFLSQAGFMVEVLREETILEDGHPVKFLWAVANRNLAMDPGSPDT